MHKKIARKKIFGKMHVGSVEKLSTIESREMPENGVIHEVMHVIHKIKAIFLRIFFVGTNDCFVKKS